MGDETVRALTTAIQGMKVSSRKPDLPPFDSKNVIIWLKRVDNAVYDAMAAGPDLETGINVMGVGNGGVGYALDEHNAQLVTNDMQNAVDQAAEQIASGDLTVHDYMSDDSCPALSF